MQRCGELPTRTPHGRRRQVGLCLSPWRIRSRVYEHISGTLVHCGPDVAVIEVGGLGYRLKVSTATAEAIRGATRVTLHTVLRLREERLVLYGFATSEERAVFDRLCNVAGVGPGTALTILSGVSLDEFRAAILGNDVRLLQRVKGIGRKTAERLVLELKDVFGAEPMSFITKPTGGLEADAIGALVALGFPAGQALDAVRSALRDLPDTATLEDLIKRATRRG